MKDKRITGAQLKSRCITHVGLEDCECDYLREKVASLEKELERYGKIKQLFRWNINKGRVKGLDVANKVMIQEKVINRLENANFNLRKELRVSRETISSMKSRIKCLEEGRI